MAQLNKGVKTPSLRTHEGAIAPRIDLTLQLRRSVMSCLLWENEFYEDGESIGNRIAELALQLPPEVVAPIAIEARERMHLRHVPLWLVRAMAPSGGKIVGETLARVIQRPDELTEFLALYWTDGRVPLSAQVKKGLALAFGKFDAYSLAKYNRKDPIKLRDVLRLVHPVPKTQQQILDWKQLLDDTLPAPETWEVMLSAGKDKQATWTHLILDNKLGGLALLRNLRNMLQVNVDRSIIREAIKTNKFNRVLPFRFISAAKHAPEFEPELEIAMFKTAESLEKLPGRTALIVDHSGSMTAAISQKSDVSRFDTACALAILLREIAEDVDVYTFSDWVAIVPPRRGFALRDVMQQGQWGSTYTGKAIRAAQNHGTYDRIIVITDEQSHDSIPAPGCKGYVINVASAKNGIGYGPWTHIDGWSEGVIDYIREVEA